MYKVYFKKQKDDESQIFKFFVTEEKAKLFSKELVENGQFFVKIEDLNDKTNNIKN